MKTILNLKKIIALCFAPIAFIAVATPFVLTSCENKTTDNNEPTVTPISFASLEAFDASIIALKNQIEGLTPGSPVEAIPSTGYDTVNEVKGNVWTVLNEIYSKVSTHSTIQSFDDIYTTVLGINGTSLTDGSTQNLIDEHIGIINTALAAIPSFVSQANEILVEEDRLANQQILNTFNTQVDLFNAWASRVYEPLHAVVGSGFTFTYTNVAVAQAADNSVRGIVLGNLLSAYNQIKGDIVAVADKYASEIESAYISTLDNNDTSSADLLTDGDAFKIIALINAIDDSGNSSNLFNAGKVGTEARDAIKITALTTAGFYTFPQYEEGNEPQSTTPVADLGGSGEQLVVSQPASYSGSTLAEVEDVYASAIALCGTDATLDSIKTSIESLKSALSNSNVIANGKLAPAGKAAIKTALATQINAILTLKISSLVISGLNLTPSSVIADFIASADIVTATIDAVITKATGKTSLIDSLTTKKTEFETLITSFKNDSTITEAAAQISFFAFFQAISPLIVSAYVPASVSFAN